MLPCSIYETLRFIPPLNVTAAEVDTGVAIFEKALAKVVG